MKMQNPYGPDAPETFTVDDSGKVQGEVSVPEDSLDDRVSHLEWDVTEDVPDSMFGRLRKLEHFASETQKDIKTLYISTWVLGGAVVALGVVLIFLALAL